MRASRFFVLLWLMLLIGWLIRPEKALAQQTDTLRVEDLRLLEIRSQNDILQGNQTKGSKTEQFYKSIKRFFTRNNLLRGMYDWFFRDPSPTSTEPQTKPKGENPYQQYDGKIIGKIDIRRIDVFGPSVKDTLRLPKTWLERTANRLHVDTKRYIIKNNYLLFEEGSPVDHQVLSNNERILRTALPNLLDARIYVLPRANNPDTVDVLVVTQDVWSISVGGGTAGLSSGDFNIEDKNLFGLGHDFRNGFTYRQNTPSSQKWGYRGRYTIPYIGKSYISAQGEYINEWNNHSYAFRLQKPFLAPSIKYAGGLELSQNRLQVPILFPTDTLRLYFPVNYRLGDLWLGRAFRFYSGSENFKKSARLVLAGRLYKYKFLQSPEVQPDTNQYQSRTTSLFSIGFARRNYFRDMYIYGFGRTEDVPYGGLISLTGGWENTQFLGNRTYAGIKMALAQYYPRFGYLNVTADAGTYFRKRLTEQGAINLGLNYFSPLMGSGDFKLRQFLNIRYRKGINRFYNEGININSDNGIRGISRNALQGEEALVMNLETVFFMPGNFMGFRLAFFTYADIGWVTRGQIPLIKHFPYQGYGIGIRVRNENLAFNTFQFRLGYYPNIPENSELFRTQFSGIPLLRIPDLAISAPEVTPFR